METDNIEVATTLNVLRRCVRGAGRPGRAQVFFKQALDNREAKLGPDDLSVATT